MNPFGQNNPTEKKDGITNSFLQGNNPSNSLFGGQPTASSFRNQSTSNPLGGQQNTSLFGMQTSNSPFGSQQTTTPFGSQQTTTPFGGQPTTTPFGGQPTTTPFGGQPTTTPFGGQPTTTPFGSSVAADSSTFQGSLFNNSQASLHFSKPELSNSFSKAEIQSDASFKSNIADQSSLLSAVKDNSLNLYNLTLQEIIDRHTALLDSNIADFERDSKSVFECDLKLIQSKNNYLSIQKKIADENSKLDELSQVLDFFEQRINEIEIGEVSDGGRIVADFEGICTKFYEKISAFKDEQDDVLDLVNENYEIIENIDKKLDLISQIKNIYK